MERNVLWAPWNELGIEHLHLVEEEEGVSADGPVIGFSDGSPFRARYQLRCDKDWRVREVRIELLGGDLRQVELRADGKGYWTNAAGDTLPSLQGCYDVDISATPFTNTLPIRRLGLRPSQAAELKVVYIPVPELEYGTAEQRYTCLQLSRRGGCHRHEGVFRRFTARASGGFRWTSCGLSRDVPENLAALRKL